MSHAPSLRAVLYALGTNSGRSMVKGCTDQEPGAWTAREKE
ncbi:MAG TPA: hypothetical protein VGR01_01710 [Burkholderiales bacterium]|jgi:hypothetical protein|nr:hypothetical protein [Burkholderiales bacterium]